MRFPSYTVQVGMVADGEEIWKAAEDAIERIGTVSFLDSRLPELPLVYPYSFKKGTDQAPPDFPSPMRRPSFYLFPFSSGLYWGAFGPHGGFGACRGGCSYLSDCHLCKAFRAHLDMIPPEPGKILYHNTVDVPLPHLRGQCRGILPLQS